MLAKIAGKPELSNEDMPVLGEDFDRLLEGRSVEDLLELSSAQSLSDDSLESLRAEVLAVIARRDRPSDPLSGEQVQELYDRSTPEALPNFRDRAKVLIALALRPNRSQDEAQKLLNRSTSRNEAQELHDHSNPKDLSDAFILGNVLAAIASPVGDANLSQNQIQEILDRIPKKDLKDGYDLSGIINMMDGLTWHEAFNVYINLAKQPELSNDHVREILNCTAGCGIVRPMIVNNLAFRPNLPVDLIQELLQDWGCTGPGFVGLARQADLSVPQVDMLRQRAGAMTDKDCSNNILTALKLHKGNRDDRSALSP
ncbi:MAG TPA: hypothetical protein VGZ00_12085 [Candidatus Baltobacteraceae bacterium]|nr:hypothetical protein [Candidatus Baltobacteraceae bacterium]